MRMQESNSVSTKYILFDIVLIYKQILFKLGDAKILHLLEIWIFDISFVSFISLIFFENAIRTKRYISLTNLCIIQYINQ